MALFGKTDAGLLLITQYFQLEFDEGQLCGSELDRWLAQISRIRNPHLFQGYPADTLWSERITGSDDLNFLAHNHSLICRIMAMEADKTPPPVYLADIVPINRLIKKFLSSPQLERSESDLGFAVEYGARSGPENMTVFGAEYMETIIRELVDGIRQKSLIRCEECAGVYTMLKKKQRFCSHRCQNRNAERRRYAARKKEEDKSLSGVDVTPETRL